MAANDARRLPESFEPFSEFFSCMCKVQGFTKKIKGEGKYNYSSRQCTHTRSLLCDDDCTRSGVLIDGVDKCSVKNVAGCMVQVKT